MCSSGRVRAARGRAAEHGVSRHMKSPLADVAGWEAFRTFEKRGPAEALKSWLEFEGVPCRIEAQLLENGVETDFRLWVEKGLAHRARWIVGQLPVSEAELEFLATGKLRGKEPSGG
jgi:hypothetical protein